MTSIFALFSVIACVYVCLSNDMSHYRSFCIKRNNIECNVDGNDGIRSNMVNNNDNNDDKIQNDVRVPVKKVQKYIIMIDVIFWMCVTDGLHGIQMCLVWVPQIFINANVWFYDDQGIMCKIISVMANFLSVLSPLWHMLLAFHLFYLLKGYSVHSLNKQKKYHYIVIVLVYYICILYQKHVSNIETQTHI